MRGDQRQVDVAAFLDRLAAIHRFQNGEFARFLLHEPRDAIEIFTAFAPRHFAPDVAVRAPRRPHRQVDIMRIRLRDFRQGRFRRRIDRREISTGMRSAKFAVDKELIARLDFDVVALLGSGRIGPAFAEIEPALVRREHIPVRLRAISTRGQRPLVAT